MTQVTPIRLEDLRRQWEQGQRAQVLRAVLERWDEVLRADADLGWLADALRTSGLSADAFALQAQIARRSRRPNEWESIIRNALQSGDPWWARTLLAEAGGGSRELQRLAIEAELAAGDAAPLIAAWVQAHGDADAQAAAVDWWVRCGRVEEAERLAEQPPHLAAWRARFALWRRDPERARAILAQVSATPATRCLEAIAAIQERRWAEAESLLDALRDSEAHAEACSWLAYLRRQQGRYTEALREADAADVASPVFNLATRLERHLARELEFAATPDTKPSLVRRVLQAIGFGRPQLRTIADLEHAAALYPLGVRASDSIDILADVLERFAGNRTPYLTTVQNGRLASYITPPDPRHLGANIQLVLWTRGPDAVRALYHELAPRAEGHPFFRIYQGEIELWLGNYEEAARIFSAVLKQDSTVKWAWIGFGASAMLQGDLAQAQKTWEQGLSITGFAGPTLYVYRGECFRRQGDVPQARRELETALQQKPNRLSAQINMALLDGEPDALARAERACIQHAPLLMEQLSGAAPERLEQVLQAMRGNRSSSPWHVSYHLWGRIWRKASAAKHARD